MLNPPFFFWKNLEKPPILQRLKPMGFFHIFPWHQRGLTTEKNPIRGSPRGSFNRRCKPWVSLMATTRKDSGASVTLTRPRQIAWQLPVATSQVEMLEKKTCWNYSYLTKHSFCCWLHRALFIKSTKMILIEGCCGGMIKLHKRKQPLACSVRAMVNVHPWETNSCFGTVIVTQQIHTNLAMQVKKHLAPWSSFRTFTSVEIFKYKTVPHFIPFWHVSLKGSTFMTTWPTTNLVYHQPPGWSFNHWKCCEAWKWLAYL